jgi:L,D-transpeptidase catalytic domain
VSDGGRLLMSDSVTIGAPASPSPVASTSVSERIWVTPGSSLIRDGYGSVIVALHLWQPYASPGHPVGGIIAFRGGNQQTIGSASSGGCFRMRDAAVRRLARLVRPGTPIVIQA